MSGDQRRNVEILSRLIANSYDRNIETFLSYVNMGDSPQTDAEFDEKDYFSNFSGDETLHKKYQCSIQSFLYDLAEIFDPELNLAEKEGVKFRLVMETSDGKAYDLFDEVFDLKFEAGDCIETYSKHGSELSRLTDFKLKRIKERSRKPPR
jgi:hypothetical protein